MCSSCHMELVSCSFRMHESIGNILYVSVCNTVVPKCHCIIQTGGAPLATSLILPYKRQCDCISNVKVGRWEKLRKMQCTRAVSIQSIAIINVAPQQYIWANSEHDNTHSKQTRHLAFSLFRSARRHACGRGRLTARTVHTLVELIMACVMLLLCD